MNRDVSDVESGDPWAYLTTKSRAMYFTAKDDCRRLITYRTESLNNNLLPPTDPLDTELLKFEKKHGMLLGPEDKAQYGQNAVVMMQERDKLMKFIIRSMLDQLGVDIVPAENLDAAVSSSAGIFLQLCSAFNSLSKVSSISFIEYLLSLDISIYVIKNKNITRLCNQCLKMKRSIHLRYWACDGSKNSFRRTYNGRLLSTIRYRYAGWIT